MLNINIFEIFQFFNEFMDAKGNFKEFLNNGIIFKKGSWA